MAATLKLACRPMRLTMLKNSCRFMSSDAQSKTKAARMTRIAKSAAAAKYSSNNFKPITLLRVGTICGIVLTGCVAYNIQSNPEGALGSMYRDSATETFVTALHQNTVGLFSQTREPISDKLMPDWPTAPCYAGVPPGTRCPPTLIVDLEGTLVASVHDLKHGWRHVKRPGVDRFIKELSEYYEIVIFSEQNIGDVAGILESIDPECLCHRMGDAAAEVRDQKVLKRLDCMNRDVRRIIVIDDNPESVQLCMENALIVFPFTDIHAPQDCTLANLIPFLKDLADPEISDYRDVLTNFGTHYDYEVLMQYIGGRERIVTSAPVSRVALAPAVSAGTDESSPSASDKQHNTQDAQE